ncbi:hypothetical protein HHK36_007985 [Tetracentron sinense]|uniref:MADS-box domain-containing protein n=1 Tax=Tetracentron sinense TaxID=13715 RepID=A0A834ZPA9_TETSI|nr:hypothetical protein HHK36_007985 [Tetracentron sinense]
MSRRIGTVRTSVVCYMGEGRPGFDYYNEPDLLPTGLDHPFHLGRPFLVVSTGLNNDIARTLTEKFRKRKKGLKKKTYEFSTLCDVDACLIIHGPNQGIVAASPFNNIPRDPLAPTVENIPLKNGRRAGQEQAAAMASSDAKARQKRKNGLKKKTYEFSTLCNVDACLIMFGPNQGEPDIWLDNSNEVQRIINRYIHDHRKEEREKRNLNLLDCLKDQTKKMEDELARFHRHKDKFENPTWDDDRMNDFSGDQLMKVVDGLNGKLGILKNKLEKMKETEVFLEGVGKDHDRRLPSTSSWDARPVTKLPYSH